MLSKCNISLFSDVNTVSYAPFPTNRTVTPHGCCGDNVLLLFKHFLCQHKYCHLDEGDQPNIQKSRPTSKFSSSGPTTLLIRWLNFALLFSHTGNPKIIFQIPTNPQEQRQIPGEYKLQRELLKTK